MSLLPAVPFVIVTLAAGVIVLLRRLDDETAAGLAGIGLAGAGAAAALLWRGDPLTGPGVGADPFTCAMGLVLCGAAAPAVLAARHVRPRPPQLGVILLTLAAALAAVAARDLLGVSAALGVVWMGAAFLVGADADERGFVPIVRLATMAGWAGAVLLFGAALAVVSVGVSDLDAIRLRVAAVSLDPGLLLPAAVALMGAACAFGLIVLPLQVASAHEVSVEAAVGTLVPLTATLAVIVRLFSTAFDPIRNDWVPVVSVSSGLLMLGGAVGALVQARLQRAAGWLGVTYAGIVLAALVPTVRGGTEAALLLMVGWTGALACAVVAVTTVPGRDAPGPLAAFGWRDGRGGFALTVALLTMAGLPATVGFPARWRLFEALAADGRVELALTTAAAGLVVLAACLRLVRRIWEPMPSSRVRLGERQVRVPTAAVVVAVVLVGLGIWAAPLITAAARVAATF